MGEHLPIYAIVPELREQLHRHNIVILEAPPGAGKSTVLPLELRNESWLNGKKVLMLEPRRLATRAVVARMASTLHEETGDTVGYSIRFERKVSAHTQVEVVTEGLLARRMQQDESLSDVGLLIFDEFHERNLHADFAFTLALEIQKMVRPDLKILIMSATLDTEELSLRLGNVPVLRSEGRQYPITVHYVPENTALKMQENVAELVARALRERPGDILVFLPGAGEILRTSELLEAKNTGCIIRPLYGDLSPDEQEAAILPDRHGLRKIVLATSIAETSLTIEGISVVVDCGYSRIPQFDPETGLDKLITVRVSKDTADQRAGRAGRLGPGHCYRMWSETVQMHLNPSRRPEILDADLSPLLLQVYSWGFRDIQELFWITNPPHQAVQQARRMLEQLGAMSGDKITAHGKEILGLPAHPRIAHMLLFAKKEQLSSLGCDIAALLDERDPLQTSDGSDLSLRCEVLQRWRKKERVNADRNRVERIERLSRYWRKIIGENPVKELNPYDVGSLLAAAYPERIAFQQQPGMYRLANGRRGQLNEHDPLTHEKWIVAAHLHSSNQVGRIFLAAPLHADEVRHLEKETTRIEWNTATGELIARSEKSIGEIVTGFRMLQSVSDEELVPVLMDAVRRDGEALLDWNEEYLQLQRRISLLHSLFPDAGWADYSREYLVSNPEKWLNGFLTPRLRKKEDFRKLNIAEILFSQLDWARQQELNKLAPLQVEVPSGSKIRIEYQDHNAPPVLAVRLQELFGMMDSPVIAGGKVKLMIHLLSPAYRPVQVTQDLRSFWTNTYAEVRKEMRSRYPKHSWPEDPFTATALRGVRKKPL